MAPPLLQLAGVGRTYPARRGLLRRGAPVVAVDSLDLTIQPGETLALVGESGSGKTTTARMVLRLEPPDSGRILFEGTDMAHPPRDILRRYRASVQAVFQDPWSSLNPRMRVLDLVTEPLVLQRAVTDEAAREAALRALDSVGLGAEALRRYPHEFSGGQRQRIAIARALCIAPRLVVLDEPVSALDVSIRAQILNLLADLRSQSGVAFLLIAHDLAAIRFLADRVAVMFRGRVVETGPGGAVFAAPRHPYTQRLIEAARHRPGGQAAPETEATATGCAFRPWCAQATTVCREAAPLPRAIGPGHLVACHNAGSFAP